MRKTRNKKQKERGDRGLFLLTCLLTFLGLVAVADASAPQALSLFSDKFYFVKQQAVWAVAGLVSLLILSRIHYSFWGKVATVFFIVNLILLVIVLIPGIGFKALGARRWIYAGPISFQPSELMKLSFVIYLAKVASSQKRFFSYFIPLGLVGLLIMLQPDLGTTLIIAATSMSQIFLAGINIFYFSLAAIASAILVLPVIIFSDYRKQRLLSFLQQTKDPLGADYHIRQVLLALGSGGLLGVGLGQSRQKYLFLPESATDSIFAIIAEEVGFAGAMVVVCLFAFFIYKGISIVARAPDKFSQVLACGIVAWIGWQAVLNIGSMVALVPLTGIPLPFFSYGGSSLTVILSSVGILLNISRYASNKT